MTHQTSTAANSTPNRGAQRRTGWLSSVGAVCAMFAMVVAHPASANERPAGSPPSQGRISTTACAARVTIKAQDAEAALLAEHAYIGEKIGKYRFVQWARSRCGANPVDAISVMDSSNRQVVFVFDISGHPGSL